MPAQPHAAFTAATTQTPTQAPTRDPIAIVGAGCRLPGAPDVDTFWSMLVGEQHAISDTAPPRLRLDGSGPDGQAPVPSQSGGFLDDIEFFDADYFDISPAVAIRMDPQHRVLMETVYDSLTDAGLTAAALAGSRTAVYTACFFSEYWDMLGRAGIRDVYATVGAGPWQIPAARISYQLDLRGPSLGVDATCATSLLAVHLACQGLWAGESDTAIVGGVNLFVTAELHHALAAAGVLSPDGRCKFGDATANGYVRSEGAVAVVLKPLSRALADGDQVYATIIGSAAGCDGRTGGSALAPGEIAQEDTLRRAYADAGVPAARVDYVEAHGVGTAVGDPRELGALSRTLGEGRPAGRPCLVGSVKSNIGHTEVVAGLAGLLKTGLALRNRVVPGTLHTERDCAALAGGDAPIEVPARTRPWPATGRPGIAGISSFGLSGTNVHLVVQEAPAQAHHGPDVERSRVLVLSARTPQALRDLAEGYAALFARNWERISLHDLCYSAGARRTHHEHRLAVVADDVHSMAMALSDHVAKQTPECVVQSADPVKQRPRVVFVFPGQGGQWAGMARRLMAVCSVFASTLHECGVAIGEELGWSVEDALRDGVELTATDRVQPAIWAVQVALAAMWRSWGVEPDLVIGHSMGEIAAAVVSGSLTVAEGAAVVCRRARLLTARPRRHGEMWAVQLGADDARAAIGELGDRVCVAVINSDYSTVLAGDPAALEVITARLRADGVFCRRVPVEFASHSPQVEDVREDLEASLTDVRPKAGTVPVHSTVFDERTDGAGFDGGYWVENLCRPVRFLSAIRAAVQDSPDTFFLEISPHPVLRSAIEDTVDGLGRPVRVAHSLRRDQPDLAELMLNLGAAFTAGCEPDWSAVYQHATFTPTPAYPWQRKRFWVDAPDPAVPLPAAVPAAPAAEPAPRGAGQRTVEALTEQLVVRTAEVLAVQPEDLDLDVPLVHTGLDSLLAIKLRTRMRQELALDIPLRELLGTGSLVEIASKLHRRSVDQQP